MFPPLALSKGKAFLVRHRVKILDGGLLLALLAAATLFAFEFDVFQHLGRETESQERVDLDELMALSTLSMLAVLTFFWRRARDHKRENERRIAAEEEVMRLALQDPLTGLPNRRRFEEALKTALLALPPEPEAHALLMIDLNGFKKINDIHGHPVGDQVLVHIGARLLRAVREQDLVARLGGDEFVILSRNVEGAEGAANIARRILDSLDEPVVTSSGSHAIGLGIGVALAPQDATTADELFRKADVALYRAKAEPTSSVRFFEPAMDVQLQQRDELERAIRDAMEADEIQLRFQPVARIGGGIAAFEASPLWSHPTFGEIAADRLSPIAEGAGVLPRLTEQLLRRSCEAATVWPDRVRLSIDLPGALLRDRSFADRILAVLRETGLPPQRLKIEIDEGALIRDAEAAEILITPLRAAGISIVADNFGTGYSDLRNLQRLKLDGIKIDGSFVAAMEHDRQAAVMVRTLIGIGQGLDLSVIADGVATKAQTEELARQGCQQAQGELIGSPVSAEQARAMVGNGYRSESFAG